MPKAFKVPLAPVDEPVLLVDEDDEVVAAEAVDDEVEAVALSVS